MKKEFWEKVSKCEHKNLAPNYSETVYCSTDFCSGDEAHCLDCGVFISECRCGFRSGMSGWAQKKWKAWFGAKENKY